MRRSLFSVVCWVQVVCASEHSAVQLSDISVAPDAAIPEAQPYSSPLVGDQHRNATYDALYVFNSSASTSNSVSSASEPHEAKDGAPNALPHAAPPMNYAPFGIKDPDSLAGTMRHLVPGKTISNMNKRYLERFLDKQTDPDALRAIEQACQNEDAAEVEKWMQVAERYSYKERKDARNCSKRSTFAIGIFLGFLLPASVGIYLNAKQCQP